MLPEEILIRFGFDPATVEIAPIQNGLINSTWKINNNGIKFILQKINHAVFKNPADIDSNISLIAGYLRNHFPDYLFTEPVASVKGHTLEWHDRQAYRMYAYINNSHTINTVQNAAQAYEAARQFGKLTAALKHFDVAQLKETIPAFHDLSMRYNQFAEASIHGNAQRIAQSEKIITQFKSRKKISDDFSEIKNDPAFKLRVTHHDTKINNVLFDHNDKGICVIDLDTLMPGYFISDVGDMMRTYLCPVSEEEADTCKIMVRKEIYDAIVSGYLSEMGAELSEKEKQHFLYAGKFMAYMQALRFLTDYLQNDRYYGAAYDNHNLVRATNQLTLLEKLEALEN